MDEKCILVLNSEKEWRIFLIAEIAEIKKNQTKMIEDLSGLKIKVGVISGIFGIVSGLISSIVHKKMI